MHNERHINYVEAPNYPASDDQNTKVFLAGGITDCPDWQQEFRAQVYGNRFSPEVEDPRITLINPRREDFDVGDVVASFEQISWEHRMLRAADLITFWFPKDTLCPIVLYELGAWSMTDKPLTIGIEPGYERSLDVRVQTTLVLKQPLIVHSLRELVEITLRLAREIKGSQHAQTAAPQPFPPQGGPFGGGNPPFPDRGGHR